MLLKHGDVFGKADPQQPSVSAIFTAAKRSCNPGRGEKITTLITSMITKEMLPLSFVDQKGFRDLMAFIEPEYTVPSRRTITARVEKMYAEKRELLKADLVTAKKVAITTDAWTSLTTESYVTVTCHYVGDDWDLKTAVLETRSSDERHTAENIAAHLRAVTEEWGVQDKVVACVHDNARNMVLANQQLLQWESVPCFAHTLQLAINDGFKNVNNNRVVAACSKLISHFHHSTVASNALKIKQALQNLPTHKLIQYCRTRWNS